MTYESGTSTYEGKSITPEMSEPENKKKRSPLKNLPPDRFQPKVLLIWVAIAIAAFTLLYWTPSRRGTQANLEDREIVELAKQ